MQKKEVLWVGRLPPTKSDRPSSSPIPTKCVRSTSQDAKPQQGNEAQQRPEKRRLCKGYSENFQINFPSTQGKVFLQISWPHLHICASLFSLSFFPFKPLCPFNHEAYYSTVRAKQFLTTGNPAGIGRGQRAHALT